MLRFYREYVERFIVAMIALMAAEKEFGKEKITQLLRSYRTEDETESQIIYDAVSKYLNSPKDVSDDSISNQEVILGATGQLRKKKIDDTDLITAIVKALSLPFSSHYFHIGNLRALREIMLRPFELAKWRKLVSETSLICRCGHVFQGYEAVTTYAVGDGSFELRCFNCARPQLMACTKCNGSAVINDKTLIMGTLGDCGCTATPKKDRPRRATPPPPPQRRYPPQPGGGAPAPARPLMGADLITTPTRTRILDEIRLANIIEYDEE